ncbi:S8 family serine peptidase [Pseudarthrobacter sp. NamE5]|uniref:S8 family serine peptidase n=1 Tax=Pseudarthrobacter sp. NamE5 TaxID=2576839 RepID=UPI00110A8152|nr:S8 family serine peptidase [Pseudarthrobacter sp. NamE5]TLM86053.1 peptidase S8 [Pseudarthrobacter sp. NamE5]
MKKILMAGFAAATMVLGAVHSADVSTAAPDPSRLPGSILVKFRDNAAASQVLPQHGLSQGASMGSTGTQQIKVPAGKEHQYIEALSRNPAVEYAEPDQVVTAATHDTFFPRQYALHNEGQSFTNTANTLTVPGGTKDADVDAVEAWGVTTGNGIKVAIIDSGVAINHEDISAKVVARENFSDTPIRPDHPEDYDKYGHGTHVAGIVAADHDAEGVAGVCPGCTILDAKVLNDMGTATSSAIVKAIEWAVDNDAKVINMSLGQRLPSRTLEAAVQNAWKEGVVIVAAAGNSGTEDRIYPAAYSNVIAVAATNNKDTKAHFSTYGDWVDVAAPGEDVYSTFPNHEFVIGTQNDRSMGYDIASGTSMASPVVAAVAALTWSTPAGTSNRSVRAKVESSADEIEGTGMFWDEGRVNACKAVGCHQH